MKKVSTFLILLVVVGESIGSIHASEGPGVKGETYDEVISGINMPDSLTGSISGRVYDGSTGTPLRFVQVRAVASDSASQGSDVTDTLGYYLIEALNPDNYLVEIREDSNWCWSSYPERIELAAGEDVEGIDLECFEKDTMMASIEGSVRLLDIHWGWYWNGRVTALSKSGTVLGVAELDGSPIDDSLNRIQGYVIRDIPFDSCYVLATVEGYLPQYYDHAYTTEGASLVQPHLSTPGIDFDLEWTIDPDSILGGVSGYIKGQNGPLPYTSVYAKNGTQLRNGSINNPLTGEYWLPLDPGVYDIYASRAGYETEWYQGSVTVANREVPGIDLVLDRITGIEEVQPSDLRLSLDILPNPFLTRTNIVYSLPREGNVTVRIYDVCGSLVSVLRDDYEEPGSHQVTWEGRDSRGNPLPSGVYYCRISLGGQTSARSVILMR